MNLSVERQKIEWKFFESSAFHVLRAASQNINAFLFFFFSSSCVLRCLLTHCCSLLHYATENYSRIETRILTKAACTHWDATWHMGAELTSFSSLIRRWNHLNKLSNSIQTWDFFSISIFTFPFGIFILLALLCVCIFSMRSAPKERKSSDGWGGCCLVEGRIKDEMKSEQNMRDFSSHHLFLDIIWVGVVVFCVV